MTIGFILWDNDGVLVDTEGGYFDATRRALAELGITLDRAHYLALRARGESAWRLAAEAGVDDARIVHYRNRRDADYQEFIRAGDIEIAGVAQVVEALAHTHRMAIVTTSKRRNFNLIHREKRLVRHMELVLTREDFENGKPAPDGYLEALERLGATPAEAVVIEDSAQGLNAACAAGIECLIVRNDFFAAHDFSAAAEVLASIHEVPDGLARLRHRRGARAR